MEKFQRAGLHAYDQVVKQLRALDVIPSLMTPKHKVIVLGKILESMALLVKLVML